MVKSGKAIYSKLNYIYIPSGRALKMYFLYSLYSLLLYILEAININPLARVLLAFSLFCSLCSSRSSVCVVVRSQQLVSELGGSHHDL